MKPALVALLVALVGSCKSLQRGTAPATVAGNWQVEGEDSCAWEAQLVLSEHPNRGHFDWKSETGFSGHELVSWTYFPDTRMIVLVGEEMQDPVGPVGVGTYVARVSADGRSISNGTWGPPASPGIWEARR